MPNLSNVDLSRIKERIRIETERIKMELEIKKFRHFLLAKNKVEKTNTLPVAFAIQIR
jgi:hypothetical protein